MKRLLLLTPLVIVIGGRASALAVSELEGQSPCQLDEATRAYAAGNFDEASRLTTACLADRPSSEARVQSYVLRAKLSLAIDDIDGAQQAVRLLLGAMPDFAPGLDDPPRFVRMVAQSKREIARNTTSSVSKMNESLLEAPATVVVVTGEQIKRRGYLDLEAVLHDLPGFDITRSNGYTYANLFQRGYRSDTTNRTLFLVDGVEQNDLYSNTAHISRQYPLTNIDRIEVVYGPASTMYGANAFLGVINVITKDSDDMIAEGKNFGAEVQGGGGQWNTRWLDGTVAGRFRSATLSLTGRVYKSDEFDLSRFDNWNYDPAVFGTAAAKAQYDRFLFSSNFGAVIKDLFGSARFEDPFNPISLDRNAYRSSFNRKPVKYSDLTDDWMVAGKLRIKNFLAGVQVWQQREGATGEGTDMEAPGALNGNVWLPRQTTFFVRYAEPLSGSLTFSYLGSAKVHSLGAGSSVFSMNGYLNGPFNLANLYPFFFEDFSKSDGDPAFWAQTVVAQSSNQIRNELNLVYRHANSLSIVSGLDLRNGSIQADYVQGTDCPPAQSLLSLFTGDQLRDVVSIFADDALVQGRIAQLIGFGPARPGVWVQCTPTGLPATLPDSGGEHFAVRDLGAFAQASYEPVPAIKLVAGGRVDNNEIRQGSGFGTVFTPRLGIVHSRRGFVAKAMYSEAFKDPSNFEKFSTLPGILDRPNSDLEPERARNFEVSAGRRWTNLNADVSVYRTTYSNLVALAPDSLANHPQVQVFIRAVSSRLPASISLDSALQGTGSAELTSAIRDALATERPEVIRQIFQAPIFIQRFENAGALRVWGVQANASYQLRGIDLFGNYTYTNPIFTTPTHEIAAPTRARSTRVGDIASHHLNLGGQKRWRQLDTSVRMNFVGTRPTVLSNSLSEVPRYAVLNAAVTYLDVVPRLSAQLVMNNIFNTQYFDPGVRTADNTRFASRIPQPGRSIFFRLMTRLF
jgi:outer membrane receptor protein involved in Fe transport